MAIYKKQFASHDEYEEWLGRAGDRIQVITVRSAEGGHLTKGKGLVKRAISITYQTIDRDLRTSRRRAFSALEAALALLVVIAGIVWFTGYVNSPPEQPKLLKLDK